MARLIASVVIGYLVMFAVVFVSFSIAYLAMGTDRALRPGGYEVTGLWIAISFALGLLAALLGGYICALIARNSKGPRALAVFVLVLGLLMAVPVLIAKPDPKPRTGPVANVEAMQNAQTPAWIALLNPFVGAVGVLLGAQPMLGKRRP